jgi:hypothetical protein
MLSKIIYSVSKNKCPRCHGSDVFISKNPFNLKTFDKMHEKCSSCGLLYEKEPGFFYGAMYVSYAIMVAWFVFTWGVNEFFIGVGAFPYLTFLGLSIILLMTPTFRISRLLWMNFFTRFGEEDKTILK